MRTAGAVETAPTMRAPRDKRITSVAAGFGFSQPRALRFDSPLRSRDRILERTFVQRMPNIPPARE